MKPMLLWIALSSLAAVLMAGAPVFKPVVNPVRFGDIESGKVVDVQFEFENAGQMPLIIKNIQSTCGCTTSQLAKKEYLPGEKGTITAKFNTTGYANAVTKSIIVISNDPQNPNYVLSFTGKVVLKSFAQYVVRPESLPLGTVKLGKTLSRTVSVANAGTIDLKLLEFSTPPEISISTPAKVIPPKDEVELTVRFQPMEKGTFFSLIRIRTNDIRTPYILLKTEAQVE